jgi:hypothetical protein
MKKIITIIAAMLLLTSALETQAGNIDFYDDGVIQEGDIFDNVDIWKTTTVDMTGGLVKWSMEVHDSGILNIYGGVIDGADVIGVDSSTLNLWGGDFQRFHRIWVYDLAIINVYGYGFNRHDSYWLDGHWVNGTPFSLYIRGDYSWERTILHEIPEPSSGLLLGLGMLLLRNRRFSYTMTTITAGRSRPQ